MPQSMFQQTVTIDGTLAANHTFQFICPTGMTLTHVSLCNTTANAGTLKIGTTSDDDAYLVATNFGVSSAPAEVASKGSFVGEQFPHFNDGDVVQLTVTDHGSHMAGVCVVLTYAAG